MSSTLNPSNSMSLGANSTANGGFIARYATAATIATFLVTGITGVLMFYHIGGYYLRTAHDWIGMAFVVAAVFHVVRNWNGCVKLMKQPRAQVVLVLVAAITAFCIIGDSLSPKSYGGSHRHSEATPAIETTVDSVS